MSKIKKLDFSLSNVPQKYVGLAEGIMLVARKINEIIDVVNSLKAANPAPQPPETKE